MDKRIFRLPKVAREHSKPHGATSRHFSRFALFILERKKLLIYRRMSLEKAMRLSPIISHTFFKQLVHFGRWSQPCTECHVEHLVCRAGSQIPVCLLITGPAVTNYGSIYENIAANLKESGRGIALNLLPSDCPNLKTALKHIIRQSVASNLENGSDDEATDGPKSKRTVCVAPKNSAPSLQGVTGPHWTLTWCRVSDISIMTCKLCMTTSKVSRCLALSFPFRTVRHSIATY